MKFFPKGSTEPVDYSKGRTEAAFVEFLNEKTGTQRTVGGALSAAAGILPDFGSIVSKVKHGEQSTVELAQKEIAKLMESLDEGKAKSAKVYEKVFEKLAKDGEYVKKEVKRLGKVLSKDGLDPKKKDELTVKLNVLKSFYSEKDTAVEDLEDAKDEL